MLFPVSKAQDLLSDPQLLHREFWMDVEHEELGCTLKYPGPFTKFSETPLRKPRKAPQVGEHNEEIYIGELGLDHEKMKRFKKDEVI